jgi:lsr operon transcriptional repressor
MPSLDDTDHAEDLGGDSEELLAHVAWYYYNDGLTQGDIAERLGLSRIKVSRMLDKGRQSGLIEVQINSPYEGCLRLQKDLVSAFGLVEARVIPSLDEAPAGPRIGLAAARYVARRLERHDLLAIGWGKAVTTALRHLSSALVRNDISLVSLTGGVTAYMDGVGSPGQRANVYLIPAPLRVSSPAFAEMLRNEPYVRNVMAMALTARTALIGVGAVDRTASLVRDGYCTPDEIELFSRQGAVGDILGYFYDRNGALLSLDLHRLVVSTPIEELRRIPTIIASAAGPEKVEPILGALRGRLVNILITDETTAAEILRRSG